MLVYWEQVSCDLLIIVSHTILQEKQLFIPDLEASDIRVVVDISAAKLFKRDQNVRFEIQLFQHHLLIYFGKKPTWYSLDSKVREILSRYHNKKLKSID